MQSPSLIIRGCEPVTLQHDVEREAERLLKEYQESDMTDINLLEALRRHSGTSPILFSLLLENLFLAAEKNGVVIASKGLIKQYMKTEHKEHPDYLYVGGETSDDDDTVIKTVHAIEIKKGILLRTLEALGLEKTVNAYVKHLLIREGEMHEARYLQKEDVERFADIDEVVSILFEECNEKFTPGEKVLTRPSREGTARGKKRDP